MMEGWARHTDPLFVGYNVPRMSPERRRGFFERFRPPEAISLAGIVDGQLVAHIVLRGLDQEPQAADLGISMDPGKIGQGIGTELLRLTLGYAARVHQLAAVTLDVAAYNERALRAYRKAGFEEISRRWIAYETPVDLASIVGDPANSRLREHIRIDTGYMISLVHMRATTKK